MRQEEPRPLCPQCGDYQYQDLNGDVIEHAHCARQLLWERLWRDPPSPDRVFHCHVCGDEVRGRAVTFDDHARATCGDCTGRVPD